jgi:hypothetical protein
MTCNWKVRLLIATMLVVAWATTAEACHRRRACGTGTCGYTHSTCGYAGSTGYYATQQGYVTDGGGYYSGGGYPGTYGGGGYPGTYGGGYPGTYGGYDFGRPGYNPGGLGGPASGLGVRPGLGVGGLGRGR